MEYLTGDFGFVKVVDGIVVRLGPACQTEVDTGTDEPINESREALQPRFWAPIARQYPASPKTGDALSLRRPTSHVMQVSTKDK